MGAHHRCTYMLCNYLPVPTPRVVRWHGLALLSNHACFFSGFLLFGAVKATHFSTLMVGVVG